MRYCALSASTDELMASNTDSTDTYTVTYDYGMYFPRDALCIARYCHSNPVCLSVCYVRDP